MGCGPEGCTLQNKKGLKMGRRRFEVKPRPFVRNAELFIRYEGVFEGATALNGVAVKLLGFKQCVISA